MVKYDIQGALFTISLLRKLKMATGTHEACPIMHQYCLTITNDIQLTDIHKNSSYAEKGLSSNDGHLQVTQQVRELCYTAVNCLSNCV